MSVAELGRLRPVEITEAWRDEAADFTPWLAKPENLEILGDTLGLQLEFEALEKSVGRFRADILCKEVDRGTHVLIENQFRRTDHDHLGKLMTYASGLGAVTLVWIAQTFLEEHRAALDWLNRVTNESVRFFGVELELWRIGDSLPAPRFNLVSKPNDWSREIARAARALDEGELSEVRTLQLDYWTGFLPILATKGAPFDRERTPLAQSWMNFPVGRTGFRVGAVVQRPAKRIRAELYISHEHAKAFFNLLEAQKEEIETLLGFSLAWEGLPEKSDARIAVYLDADPENREDWSRQHEWLAEHIAKMHRVLEPKVRALDPADWVEDALEDQSLSSDS